MKPVLSLTVTAVLLVSTPMAGAQDVTQGTILALDRKAKLLVLTDRTVWALELLKTALPSGIEAGSRVHIEYQGDEDGVSAIKRITPMLN